MGSPTGKAVRTRKKKKEARRGNLRSVMNILRWAIEMMSVSSSCSRCPDDLW